MTMTIKELPLTNNRVKLYHHEPLQRLNSEDINRMSGSNNFDSAFIHLITAVQATIGKTGQIIPMGFKIIAQTASSLTMAPGIIISSQGIFQFPGRTIEFELDSLWGKLEFELATGFDEDKSKFFYNMTTRNFDPQVGPSRKVYDFNLREVYTTDGTEPEITPSRYPLLQYKRSAIGEPIRDIEFLIEIFNSGDGLNGKTIENGTISNDKMDSDVRIGSLGGLASGITGPARESVTNAINFLFAYTEQKNFLRTIPSPGFDDGIIRVRTQGNLAWWDKGDWTFRPFA
jgi:hypothetical protein